MVIKFVCTFLLLAGTALAQLESGTDPAYLARFFPAGSDPGTDAATGWAARVVANGGAAPSAGTKSAIATFVNMLNTASLTNKMYTVNVVAPDSLIAIRTPLIYKLGVDPWNVGASFPDANRSVNGYTGTGVSSFWLSPGFAPNDVSGRSTNIGYTIYYYTAASEARNDMGVTQGTVGYMSSYINGIHRAYDTATSGSGRFESNDPNFVSAPGLISYNRTTDLKGRFWGGRSTGFGQYGGDNSYQGAESSCTNKFYFFTANIDGTPQNGTTKTLSFLAIHEGLSGTEASNLWYAVQVLRTNLGGGYR